MTVSIRSEFAIIVDDENMIILPEEVFQAAIPACRHAQATAWIMDREDIVLGMKPWPGPIGRTIVDDHDADIADMLNSERGNGTLQ